MAISPPSDLVLDVVKAADPVDVQAAQAKLQANRAAFAATSLAEAGNGFQSTVDVLNSAATKAGLGNAKDRTHSTEKVPATYHKFEAMVLQNFVKNMLPNSETLYGKGTAGEMWKGMMAEQLGNTIAKNGGVGIAEQMYKEQLDKTRSKGIVNASTDENDRKMALSMITDFQRKTLDTASTDGSSDASATNQSLMAKKA
ncbi:rod-binding protein [Neorhizobium sp. P12A]|uniref:rod-binding protein n=1 Tax=Neorhizobium sp. P12A TaxID=2268027 RepID=UPI0011EBB127|nr:rod-binding protein [Neorhizobium sp. P12A]KAA0699534.1 rod-binding protein [Neorhizobium sp. P12A]